jgi:chromosome partitioning protein
MPRIITIASQKGGVGKTTTTLNLGYSLSRFGHRVLLVDADPQGGMAIASDLRKRSSLGLVQLVSGRVSAGDVIIPTRDGSMAMMASGVVEPGDALLLEDAAHVGRVPRAIKAIAHGYSYVLLDAPAGIGSVVRALLCASNSLPTFLRLAENVRERDNPGLEIEGALISMRDARSTLEEEALAQLRAGLPEGVLFNTSIDFDEAFERANQRALPVALLPEAAAATRAFMDLAMELMARERERQAPGGGEDESAQGLF